MLYICSLFNDVVTIDCVGWNDWMVINKELKQCGKNGSWLNLGFLVEMKKITETQIRIVGVPEVHTEYRPNASQQCYRLSLLSRSYAGNAASFLLVCSSYICDYRWCLSFNDALSTVMHEASNKIKHYKHRFWELTGCGQFGGNIPIFSRGNVRKHDKHP
jgi:hypothetical protein